MQGLMKKYLLNILFLFNIIFIVLFLFPLIFPYELDPSFSPYNIRRHLILISGLVLSVLCLGALIAFNKKSN